MPVSWPVLALAWGLTFAGSAVHGTIGMGIALVSVPILALVDPSLVPVPQMLLALVLNSFLFWKERGALDTAGLGWVIAGRVPGAVLGAWLVAVAREPASSPSPWPPPSWRPWPSWLRGRR